MIAWQGLDHPIHPPQEKISRDAPQPTNMGLNQSTNCLGSRWVFPKMGIPPKWMVYNGNPSKNGMIWGEKTLFSETPPLFQAILLSTWNGITFNAGKTWSKCLWSKYHDSGRYLCVASVARDGWSFLRNSSWRSLLDRFEVDVFLLKSRNHLWCNLQDVQTSFKCHPFWK